MRTGFAAVAALHRAEKNVDDKTKRRLAKIYGWAVVTLILIVIGFFCVGLDNLRQILEEKLR